LPDLFLLHFEPRYRHAQHYLGYAVGTGRGYGYARDVAAGLTIGPHELVMAAQWDGVEITVADVLVGEGRETQRRMRGAGSLSRFCHICRNAGSYHR
jgi:alpha-D-ribose 1-methylphosphonate 5-triphosphate synthase subunit PhnI